ncbi:hypothetical protein C7379_12227 [Hallella colorans]|uniref:Uncharacterized protein n=1 Tax=Hallella colorans TaxID=1703337 RepID=A0A2U0TZ38_9BACT|nr:hypothetical protein C7379_12227 [Hallella colorans]
MLFAFNEKVIDMTLEREKLGYCQTMEFGKYVARNNILCCKK